MRWAALLVLLSTVHGAEVLVPKAKPEEYSFHLDLKKASIGAEYHAHTIPSGATPLFTSEYLVIEIAFFPMLEKGLPIRLTDFTLRLNGKKQAILAHDAGLVVTSIRNSGWSQLPAVVIGVGDGDREVVMGGPQRQPRFPGDPNGSPKSRPRVPTEPDNTAEGKPEIAPKPEEIVPDLALQGAAIDHPVAGYLYFPYAGKLKALKSIELTYDGPAGSGKLVLN